MKKEIVALVPVKGISERVKNKNMRPFYNTSLYELKLKHLKNVRGFSKIIISSENREILNIAQCKGFEIHVRDPKYSTSTIPMSEVYLYIASEIQGEHIAWVNVTNPLAEANVYEKAIEEYKLMDPKHDCLLSVYEVKDYLFCNGKPVNFQPNPWPRSQDLSGVCAMSYVVNILPEAKSYSIASDGTFTDYLSIADLLVSFSSTTIEDALQNDVPVLLYNKYNRYQHIRGIVLSPGVSKIKPSAVYNVNREQDLLFGLEWILANHLFKEINTENLFKEYKFLPDETVKVSDFINCILEYPKLQHVEAIVP